MISQLRRKPKTFGRAKEDLSEDQVQQHDCGNMDIECKHCHALLFKGEAKSFCCQDGRVVLPPLYPFPDTLSKIWGDRDFQTNIRSYNSNLSFTSLGYKKDSALAPNGIFTFRIQGTMYHNIGNLMPQTDHLKSQNSLKFISMMEP